MGSSFPVVPSGSGSPEVRREGVPGVRTAARLPPAARPVGHAVVNIGGAGSPRLPGGDRFWRHPAFSQRTLPRGRAHARLRDHLEAKPDGEPWAYLIPPPAFHPDGPRTGHCTAWPPSTDESDFTHRAISYADFAVAVVEAVHERRTGTRLIASGM